MTKRGGVGSKELVLLAVIIVAALGIGLFFGGGGNFQQLSTSGNVPTPIQGTTASAPEPSNDQQAAVDKLAQATLCSGNANPVITLATINKEKTTSTDYNSVAATFRQKDDTSNRFTLSTNAGATENAVTDSTHSRCGKTYEVIVESNQSNVNGAYFAIDPVTGKNWEAVPGGLTEKALPVSNFSNLQCRIKDLDLGDYIYTNTSDPSAAAGLPTAYQPMRGIITFGTAAVADPLYNTTTLNGTAKTIGADQNTLFRYQIECQTISSYGRFGAKTYLAVDYGSTSASNNNDWQEPIIRVGSESSNSLSNVKSTLDGDDQTALGSYGVVYDLGTSIGGNDVTYIYASMKTGNGQNPAYDPAFRFLPSGIKQSVKTPGTYLGIEKPRFFDDTTSRTQIASSTVNGFAISVA